jgi:hypothetical protein
MNLTHPRLSISFSGGRTSAYMTRRLVEELRGTDVEVAVLFCNTGSEHPKTLDFVDRCDREWGLGVVWLEADIDPQMGRGVRPKVVTYETASREGAPYEALCAKYGIPGPSKPICTTLLKMRPMEAYRRDVLGWKTGKYHTAIGIRADEIDRMNSRAEEFGLVYPLIDWGIRKKDILAWWAQQSWGLDLPEQYGNCTWCWKKTDRKLFTLAQDDPTLFDFPARMEREYGHVGTLAQNSGKPQLFFRKNRTTQEILEAAARFPRTERFVDHAHQADDRPFLFLNPDVNGDADPLDQGSSCGESCEVGADEQGLGSGQEDWMEGMGWLEPEPSR